MRLRIVICMLVIGFTGCSAPVEQENMPVLKQQPERPRILIVGFDGATWDSLQTALNRGLMPNLSGLIRKGANGRLATIRPTLTPIIWTTIATGKMPEKHGISSLLIEDKDGSKHRIDSLRRKVKTLWQILSEEGREVCVVRWPVSWPAEEVRGQMISEYAFQRNREFRTYPPKLAQIVDRHEQDFRLDDIESLTGVNQRIYDLLDTTWQWKLMLLLREYDLDVQFKETAKELLRSGQRDFTAVYFYSMDALGHSFFKFNDPEGKEREFPNFTEIIPNWCWLYDTFLGEILALIDASTYVIVCSDHGMELALEPQKFIIRAENDPPKPDEPPEALRLPTAPAFDADPFSVQLQYTEPSGQHVNAPDGIFVMTGPGIKRNCIAQSVSVADIASTVLYAMGLPVAKDFDGKLQTEFFTDDFKEAHPVEFIDTYEDDELKPKAVRTQIKAYEAEDALILNHLQALGYIQ
ncbi:alkaline phosphatase family protein [bacterium]|nr:alkaline phosphatase family protein [candidate division CSSED10-310 bacterium]